MRYFLIFIFLFLIKSIYGQNTANKQNPITLYKKADSLIQTGDYTKAGELLNKALNTAVDKDDKLTQSHIYSGKALLEVKEGNPKKGLELTDSLLKNSPYDKTLEGKILNIKGLAYLNLGINEKAGESFNTALKKYQEAQKKHQKEIAECYNNLGLVYWNSGHNKLAGEYHHKALSLRKEIYGKNHSEVAASYNNLGLLYSNTDPEKALDFYNKSLKINKKRYSEQHPAIASSYNNIAIIYKNQNDQVKAHHYFEKVLNIWKSLKGPAHPNVAFVYSNIGQVYEKSGKPDSAIQQYKKSLKIYKKNFGNQHPEVANIKNLLAVCYREKGNFEKALFLIQEALIANTPGFSNNNIMQNPGINQYFNGTVLLYSLMLKAQTLEGIYRYQSLKTRDIQRAYQGLMLCDSLIVQLRHTRSHKEDKLQLGKLASEIYEDGIRVTLKLHELTWNKQYLHDAFYFAERNKASVLHDAISEANARKYANIPDSILKKEKKLRSSISWYEQKLAKAKEQETINELHSKMFDVKRKHNDLITRIEKENPKYYNLKFNADQADIREIQKDLSKEEMVVLYSISEKDNRLYSFFIRKNDFRVKSTVLGQDFYKNIKGMRNGIIYKSKNTYTSSSRALFKKLFPGSMFDIFSQRLPANISKLIIIPDGKLNTIPFEALLTQKVKKTSKAWPYLLKKTAVQYAYSATLLTQSNNSESLSASNKIFLCAPVEFSNKKEAIAMRKGVSSLPATKTEVEKIKQLFEKKGKKAQIYLKEKAQEDLVKSDQLKNYEYIHFATHGIVNETHPELSRIFLATDPTNQEDGLLRAGEIYNLDLKAELVTLSACETGLGKFTRGEGIIGLTRALLYAGAENIMVSLWSVSDKSTSDLMIRFYKNILNGMNKPEALQEAKLSMIKEGVPGAGDKLDIFFWSPFILIGG